MRQLTFSILKNCKQKILNPRFTRGLCSKSDQVKLKVDPDHEPEGGLVHISSSWPAQELESRAAMLRDMRVLPDFISESEEAALMAELQPYLAKMRYEFDHWDNAIHGYRETERSEWSAANRAVLDRVRAAAFRPGEEPLPHQHVLDLAPNGHIKPHVDAVRFCGPVIAGLCLLSPALMRLARDGCPDLRADALLPRRALYIMRDSARYSFSHAILESGAVWRGGRGGRGGRVSRARRVAVISRSAPPPLH